MKSKILILLIAFTLIISLNSVFAIDDIGDDVSGSCEIDQVEEIGIDESQTTLTSDDANDELSLANDVEVLADAPVYVNNAKVTNRYYDGVVYTATFYDYDGNPLKNAPVFCGMDSKDLGNNQYTDSNGVAKFALRFQNGNHKLYLMSSYNSDNPYVDNINVFNVIDGGKNIKMYYDDGNIYKVRIYGDDGKPVKAGQKVTFKIGNKKYTKLTDKNGYAKLKITSKPGVYYIYTSYKDYNIYNSVRVKDVIKANTGSLGKGLSKTFKVKIKYLGKNKKNKLIKVKFNKKTYKAKTNKKGVALFKIKSPKKLGKYKLVAIYKQCKVSYEYSQYRTG